MNVGILVHGGHVVRGVESLSAISNFDRSVDGRVMDSIIDFSVATALLSHWKNVLLYSN